MDDLTPEQRRKNMQAIKSKDTRIELTLRNALWHKGIHIVRIIRVCPASLILRSQNTASPYSVILISGTVMIGKTETKRLSLIANTGFLK